MIDQRVDVEIHAGDADEKPEPVDRRYIGYDFQIQRRAVVRLEPCGDAERLRHRVPYDRLGVVGIVLRQIGRRKKLHVAGIRDPIPEPDVFDGYVRRYAVVVCERPGRVGGDAAAEPFDDLEMFGQRGAVAVQLVRGKAGHRVHRLLHAVEIGIQRLLLRLRDEEHLLRRGTGHRPADGEQAEQSDGERAEYDRRHGQDDESGANGMHESPPPAGLGIGRKCNSRAKKPEPNIIIQ